MSMGALETDFNPCQGMPQWFVLMLILMLLQLPLCQVIMDQIQTF